METIIKRLKRKYVKWMVLIIILGVFASIMLNLFKDNGNFLRRTVGIGESSNVELLKYLNDEWILPEDYSLEIKEVEGITMEWIQAKDTTPEKAILQLHGGAYNRSLKENGTTYRRAAVQYAKISGAGVLTVDYRVAPQHPYPAALEDALLAYKWLLEQGYPAEDIILAGDSAGGGLTLATVLYLKDNDMKVPAGLITMSAWTDLNYKRIVPGYVGDNHPDNPYISPIYGEYDGFPPMLMQVGGDEFLLNDTIKVSQKAEAAGVSVKQTTYPGMFHVFQMLFPELTEANSAWNEVEEFIKAIS